MFPRWALLLLAGLASRRVLVDAANVLVVATVSSPSHYIWTSRLTEGLLQHGHHVTEFTIRKPTDKHPNRTSFIVEDNTWAQQEVLDLEAMSAMGLWEEMLILDEFAIDVTNFTLGSKAFGDLVRHLKDKRPRFDIMIIDITFQEALLGISTLVGRPPVVAVTAFNLPEQILALMGTPYFPSLLPYNAAGAHGTMSFCERAYNMAKWLFYKAYLHLRYRPMVNDIMAKAYNTTATLDDLENDVAIALVNTSPALHGSMPLPPSIVEVGGLQARAPKPLPDDLLSWINEDVAPIGFVLMSFGTNFQSSFMTKERKNSVIKALGRVKQRVLWKYEEDDILDQLPPNVRAVKWVPQNDLLGHPNIRAFISHNGGLSTQESCYHGVPMVGVPFCVDQIAYAEKIELLGLGRRVAFRNLTEESLFEALSDVINNPRYRENMRQVRATLRDQKETPLERAVWWVEYVARNRGAPHLRAASYSLRWYQTWMLDVLASAAAALVAVLLLLRWVVRRLLSCLTGGNASPRPRKQKAH